MRAGGSMDTSRLKTPNASSDVERTQSRSWPVNVSPSDSRYRSHIQDRSTLQTPRVKLPCMICTRPAQRMHTPRSTVLPAHCPSTARSASACQRRVRARCSWLDSMDARPLMRPNMELTKTKHPRRSWSPAAKSGVRNSAATRPRSNVASASAKRLESISRMLSRMSCTSASQCSSTSLLTMRPVSFSSQLPVAAFIAGCVMASPMQRKSCK
mmetsp:Transcript_88169/g.175045  ORF Transcript_88169/g.175045 Transcript_88169/m.175045 type:complete len:212 (-) Transcript_88169:52-687(-)